jgi:Cu-processing system ATP-binding protein
MIHVRALSKQFGKLHVLHDINLDLTKGDCIAMIGPNGCGKTTLIKSILGMVLPSSGDILFNAKSIKADIEYRKHIGYMPQIGRYPDNMTIGQIIHMVKEIRQSKEVLDLELYQQFEMDALLNKRMGSLSGGTTQKVSAVLTFLFNPAVLILDEPTAGLDPIASEILKEKILKEKKNGKLILITSHLLSELDDLVNKIIFMQDGHVVFFKPVEDLMKENHVDKISKAVIHILKQSRR